MSSIETETLIGAVPQKVHAIRRLLDDYKRELTDPAWQKFIEGIQTLVEVVEAYHQHNLAKAMNLAGTDLRLSDSSKRDCSKIALTILANIQREYLPFLEKGSHQAEYILLPSIQGVVRAYNNSAEIALVPDFDYNYSYIGFKKLVAQKIEELRGDLDPQYAEECSARAARLPEWNVFLQYPLIEDSSALNLCVLAHELAHFLDDHKGLYKQLRPDKLDQGSFAAWVNEICSITLPASGASAPKSGEQLTLGFVLSPQAIEAEQYKRCIITVDNWLREIVADILAVHALGPAYFFAIMELFAHAAAENQPAETHPAMAIRLELLAEELEYLEHLKGTGPIVGVLRTCKVHAAEEASTTQHWGPAKVAHETLKQHLPNIKTKLREFMKEQSYTAARYERCVGAIVDELLTGCAPIERLEPGTSVKTANYMTDVFNAGWEVYKTKFDQFASLFVTDTSQQEILNNLNQLVFKAVEAGEVIRRWNKAKSQ